MQITTKFNIGDSVVFIRNDALTRAKISKIQIEVLIGYGDTPGIQYFFNSIKDSDGNPSYRYESEVAKTKEDLVAQMIVSQLSES